ncbi:MAG: hypothetical protein ACP5NL_03450 [Thermoplasmata archaeon]
MYKKTISLIVMALVITSISVPLVSASSLTVHVYPAKNQAEINAVSNTKIVFTYPNQSAISDVLNGTNYSYSMEVNITHGDSSIAFFEGFLRSHYTNISVENMSVTMNVRAVANNTTLVITKNMNINIWISGIFNKTKNGTTIANMSWRDFAVNGKFDVNYNGKTWDINEAGGMMNNVMGNGWNIFYLMFENNHFLARSTINYSALKAPLTDWNRNYDASNNSTSFTYVYNKIISFNSSADINGAKYTLNMSYDPSATIVVPGYATASGDSLIITPTASATAFPYLLVGIAAVVVIVIVLGAALIMRRK